LRALVAGPPSLDESRVEIHDPVLRNAHGAMATELRERLQSSRFYSVVGRPSETREVLAAFERDEIYGALFLKEFIRQQILGHVAMAEGRYEDAAREYRAGDLGQCTVCALPDLARAYELAGNADSAVAVFTRYVTTPSPSRYLVDGGFLAGAHKRLGELHEARGDRVRATHHYAKFVELWKDADPELQPKVADVRRRLARLTAAEPR
jgi:tetratricopeptide (TPR) repeat protein